MCLWGRSQSDRHPALAGRLSLLMLCLLLLAGAASCGGATVAGGAPADSAGLLNFDDTSLGGAELAGGVLPSIPLDESVEAGRAASDLGDPQEVVVLGSEFLVQWSGEVQETALLLDPALEEENDRAVAFGMYKVGGLSGKRPLGLKVDGEVREGGQYFVAIANYTRGNWQWFGPGEGEFNIDLRDERGRYVSRAGNIYFLVVAHRDNAVLHNQTTALIGPAFHDDHPGFPVALRASDGEFPAKIEVKWLAGEGAVNFELFRATPVPPGQRPDWVSLGFTTEESWQDTQIIPDKVYIYKVRAINEAGRSAFSNVDPGFAGELPQHFEGAIGGRVVHGGTDLGVPGIKVFLLGAPNANHLETVTGEHGQFGFPHLPAGMYIVFAQNPTVEFEPKFVPVLLNPQNPQQHLRFETRPPQHTRAFWGFVYAMGGPDHPGLHPLKGVPVAVKKLGNDDPPVIVHTNELGFWMSGPFANGDYVVKPLGPPDGSVVFLPDHRPGHIDGEHITPAMWFRAVPGGDGGDGPGDPQ